MKYVLVTSARDEEAHIEQTLKSVCAQTVLPERWAIFDDGSTDNTTGIVARYAAEHSWVELIRRSPDRGSRSFARKAEAINSGFDRFRTLPFEVMGNLDADVSFEPDYMEFMMEMFSADPGLGVGGTPFTEDGGYDSTKDSFEGCNFVAGPCQLFRRRCFEEIGGYLAHAAGGVDWIAVMSARMKGWTVRSFPAKRFHHHRSMGTAGRSPVAALFSYGEKDYYLGGSPIWQLFRVAYRMAKRPMVIGGLALFFGYLWAALRRVPRPVSPELMRFHRREQMKKLGGVFRSLIRLDKPDSFYVASDRPQSR